MNFSMFSLFPLLAVLAAATDEDETLVSTFRFKAWDGSDAGLSPQEYQDSNLTCVQDARGIVTVEQEPGNRSGETYCIWGWGDLSCGDAAGKPQAKTVYEMQIYTEKWNYTLPVSEKMNITSVRLGPGECTDQPEKGLQ